MSPVELSTNLDVEPLIHHDEGVEISTPQERPSLLLRPSLKSLLFSRERILKIVKKTGEVG